MTFTDNKAVRSGNSGETLDDGKTHKPQPVVVENVQEKPSAGQETLAVITEYADVEACVDGAYSEEND